MQALGVPTESAVSAYREWHIDSVGLVGRVMGDAQPANRAAAASTGLLAGAAGALAAPPRRVLFAINSLACGGAEQQLVRVAAYLRAQGCDVGVMTLLRDDYHRAQLVEIGATVHDLQVSKWGRGLSAVAQARAVLRSFAPEVVVSFLYQASIVARLASRAAGVPHVSSMRDEYFGGWMRDQALARTDRLAAVTVINSRLTAAKLVRRGVVSARRVRIIPNGLDPTVFDIAAGERAPARDALGVAPQDFLWIGIGRLQPQKAWDDLIHAIALMRPDVRAGQRWLVIGTGPLLSALDALASELGVSDYVRFIGPRTDVPRLLAACDALVLPSHHEGMPNVVMEAMAARRPVVATDVGGVAELVADGVSGLVLPAADHSALSSAMSALAVAPIERREAMGEAGRQLVDRQYTIAATMPMWSSLLAEVVA